MVSVSYKDGFIVEKTLCYAFEQPHKEYINLAKTLGEDMRYEKIDYALVDYPGEYDIQGIMIQAFLGADQKLNYIADIHGEKIWIVQSLDVLDLDEFGFVRHWLYTDDNIANKLEQLELEGEKQKLEVVEK